jgi:hypothetical protein
MAEIKEAYKILMEAEFSKNPNSFLHLNKTESGYTLGGIYQKWHPHAIDWDFISQIVDACDHDIKRASRLLYFDTNTQKSVYSLFKLEYWDKNKLGHLDSQIIANELFISATNIGNKKAIQLAQELIEVIADGIIGVKTIRALNNYDEVDFSNLFDIKEKENYDEIIENNPDLAINEDGWNNRAELV